jgi:MoaA/NifB/PqqE/SkfB family radical SAM enzyme
MRRSLPALTANVFRREATSHVLFVTNRCNLDCEMCFYTAREHRDELTVEEYQRLAAALPPQWYLMFTGGEPFVRSDLPEIVRPFYNRGAVNLHIATNATLFDRTVEGATRIAEEAQRARVIIVLSIDGPAELHDRIRRRNGTFDRTVATARELLTARRRLHNLAVVANFTMTSYNQHAWRTTVDFLRDELAVDAINIGLVRGTVKNPIATKVDPAQYVAAQQYLAKSGNRRPYFSALLSWAADIKQRTQARLIADVATGRPTPGYTCMAGRVFAVVSETGDVYPCEMLGRSVGNLRQHDFDYYRMWNSAAGAAIRAHINTGACQCTYECAMGATLAVAPWG